jgi:hypothetical protein
MNELSAPRGRSSPLEKPLPVGASGLARRCITARSGETRFRPRGVPAEIARQSPWRGQQGPAQRVGRSRPHRGDRDPGDGDATGSPGDQGLRCDTMAKRKRFVVWESVAGAPTVRAPERTSRWPKDSTPNPCGNRPGCARGVGVIRSLTLRFLPPLSGSYGSVGTRGCRWRRSRPPRARRCQVFAADITASLS